MKKLLLAFVAVLMATFAFADDVNVSWAGQDGWSGIGEQTITYGQNGIALTAVKNDGATNPTVNANAGDLRVYAKGTLTVSAGDATITKIVFNISTQGMKRLTDITASTGTAVVDVDAKTVTWTGSSSNVSLTVGEKAVYGSDGDSKAGQFDVDSPITVSCTGTPNASEGGNTGGGGNIETVDITNTLETAYTVSKAIELIDAGKGLDQKVYVKGYVTAPYKDMFVNTQYGDATFFITEDGLETSPQFEIYQGLSFGGEKFAEGEDFKLGDAVVFYGKLKKYNTTYEFDKGSVLMLLNGETSFEEEVEFAAADATGLTATYNTTVLLPVVAEVPGMGEWIAPGQVAQKSVKITGDAEGNVTVTGLTDETLYAQYVSLEEEGEKYYYLIFNNAVSPIVDDVAYAYVDGDFIAVYYGLATETAIYYDALCVRENAALKDVTLYTATVEQMDVMGVLDIEPITTTCYVQDCGDYLTIYNLGGYSLLFGEKDAQGNIVLDASQEWPYILDFMTEDNCIVLTANADGTFSYEAQMAYFGPNSCVSIKLAPAGADAIMNLNAEQAAKGIYYNLAGQRVNASQKGLVIKNGKKIMVK